MKSYLQLIKINITILVVITSYLGYYLGLRYMNYTMIEYESWIVFLYLILGTFISSSGACILNQYVEVEFDKKMQKTKDSRINIFYIKTENELILYKKSKFYIKKYLILYTENFA